MTIERAHVLIAKFGADTHSALAEQLRDLADEIAAGGLSQKGIHAGPRGSTTYSYSVDPSMTHDEYFRRLEDSLREEPEHDPG